MSKTLYLLDGMALAYRAHFALINSPIRTSKGFNTSALFGFTATLIDLVSKGRPSHLAVVFDTDAPTQRHRLHPEYKAHREDMPEDLAAALPHLRRLAAAFDIPVLAIDGYEADDIIGTLAHRAAAEGFDEVFMVTPDKDFGQLVSDKIRMYRPSRKGDGVEILGPVEVREKWGIERVDQVIDMLGLCGDASDNIPGVPGIGPKTAQKLLAEYDTVEGLLEHVDELKGKQRERVRDHAAQALLSKKLATIQLDVPVEVDWEALELTPPDREKLAPVLAEFEFRTLGKRLFGDDFSAREEAADLVLSGGDEDDAGGPAAGQMDLLPETRLENLSSQPHDYRVAATAPARAELAAALREAGTFAFDTETTGLNPRAARLVGISFSTTPHAGWFVPVPEEPAASGACFDELAPVFADPAIGKTGHNLKFDLSVLAANGIEVRGTCFDTMLAHALLEPGQRHGLNALAEDLLGYSPIPFERLVAGAAKGTAIDYSQVDPAALADYATEDADVAGRLRTALEPSLAESGQARVFHEIETPLLPVLAAMEMEGIRLDEKALAESSASFAETLLRLQEKIHAAAGREFNLNSPKQLGEVLFDELKLIDKPKKTRTGQYSTNEQVLAALAPHHPIVADLLEYRSVAKLKSTYADALPEAVDPVTGRIHTHFGQLQTATGRLSSNDPNLQNIPVRSELGREIRRAFVPREGWLLLSADYSQIELRILAALSRDEGLLNAFREGRDIHSATAARIFKVDPAEVTREQRSTAKMVNFGIPYGISAFGLAQRLGTVSRTEAQAIIDAYFAEFPGIPGYMQRCIEGAREKGFVETVSGRRRHLPDINSSNGTIRGAAERNAINMPIQGTAADMIKRAMIRIHQDITEKDLKSRLLLQVHDELLFDLDPAEEDVMRALVGAGMREALPLDCPIEVEMGTGRNWLEAH